MTPAERYRHEHPWRSMVPLAVSAVVSLSWLVAVLYATSDPDAPVWLVVALGVPVVLPALRRRRRQ